MNSKSQQKPTNTGLKRIWAALLYSVEGIKSACKTEESFRQELILSAILLPILLLLSVPVWLKWFLFFAHLHVLIAELINSAIEAVVDLVSPGFHPLAKKAKDIGSAAVLLTLFSTTGLW